MLVTKVKKNQTFGLSTFLDLASLYTIQATKNFIRTAKKKAPSMNKKKNLKFIAW